MRYVTIISLLFFSFAVNAQNYAAILIPDSLTKGANVVKRMEEVRVTMKAIDKVIVKHRYAITILNEKGDRYAQYHNNYSSLEGLSDITGNLYDAFGKKIKSVKKKDIEDVPVSDGASLMNDDRIKAHNFYHRQYPYTIEYEDEQQVRGSFFLQNWHPVPSSSYSVEQSRYIVEIPAAYNLRIQQKNFTDPPITVKTPSVTSYTWELKNYKAVHYEVYSPSLGSIVPYVNIGASDFSFGGYTGNMNTWLDFGKFNITLAKGRDVLPEYVKKEVHALVDGISDKEERIKKLYNYLQSNTRYIGIQLGIGGWQPFDAKYVATNKYGDCKALSNYMVSLLKEAGIKGNMVLIYAGDDYRQLQEDFPISTFNHMIACVPNGKDTIWLECTSQTKAAGFMGTFTGGRKALLIDDDGGHVVSTPDYNAEDNLQLRSINAVIDIEGNLVVDVNTHFTGTQQELQHALMHDVNPEQRERYLNSVLNLPTYKVIKSEYKETKSRLPVVDEYLHIQSLNYATVSGRRLFIEPNLFNKSKLKLLPDEKRKYPIEFNSAHKDVDTIHLVLPEGYSIEAMPKDVNITNKFAQYSISFKVDGNKVYVIRTETINNVSLSAEAYSDLVKYYDAIYKADHSRIVFVKGS
jgi:transglutaminase-like putative cysteine protease